MSEPLVELKGVTKTYLRGTEEIRAIDDIDLEIDRGEYLSIVGPSGSGKTTLLNMVGCVDVPTTGAVLLEGVDVGSLKEKKLAEVRSSTVGFVFQQFFLLPTLTALENVVLPGMFNGYDGRRSSLEAGRRLLGRVGLDGRADHLPSQLSGGEMQRVAVARALFNEPKLVLADEPTGNLDSRHAREIVGLFEELNRDGLTVVFVTHNEELARRARRRVALKDGRLT